MDKKNISQIILSFSIGAFIIFMVSCEGPVGQPGVDANESCKTCHNPNRVDYISIQYELSKHATGEAYITEAGNTACAPCHETTGFSYVCTSNTPSTFTQDTTGKYFNNYITSDAATYGKFSCRTCHSSIHKNYDSIDFYPLTTTAAVSMTMWAGKKTIDLTQNQSKSNLCIKCHQPRPIATSTTLSDGNVVDYADLAANPTTVYYDSAVGNAKPNKLTPGYRTHVHYGGVGAIVAGIGGVEFSGSLLYTSSKHASVASCQDCHMGAMVGGAGGHTFNAKGNYKGCNTSACHGDAPYSSSSANVVAIQTEIKGLLATLASKLKSGGVEILHRDATSTNLWLGITANNYDGYLNIYDPSANPGGGFQNPAPAKTWTSGQKATNAALPKFTSLKNVQLGAIINFQLCLREYSLGIHNYPYSKALLTNSIDALTAAGY